MIRGAITLLLLTLNAVFWGSLIAILGIAKFSIQFTAPRSRARTRVILILASLGSRWVGGNDRIFDAMLPTQWQIEGIGDDVKADGHYLIIANHLSWVDIFALFRAFHGRTAFIRFFLKQQLIRIPIVGQACWALEFPFMRRYSPEYLARHPEKRGTDLATTRKACQRYRNFPVAILNFVEGTRFSQSKRDEQDSPFRHLLRPRIGGISFVLASLGDQLDAIYDVTLAYPPDNDITLGRFLTGRVTKIIVHARRLSVPESIDRGWLDAIWKEKDDLLTSQLRPSPSPREPVFS
jgi:1-acyl-sn-glycerol-3-phosphate acyltransferase